MGRTALATELALWEEERLVQNFKLLPKWDERRLEVEATRRNPHLIYLDAPTGSWESLQYPAACSVIFAYTTHARHATGQFCSGVGDGQCSGWADDPCQVEAGGLAAAVTQGVNWKSFDEASRCYLVELGAGAFIRPHPLALVHPILTRMRPTTRPQKRGLLMTVRAPGLSDRDEQPTATAGTTWGSRANTDTIFQSLACSCPVLDQSSTSPWLLAAYPTWVFHITPAMRCSFPSSNNPPSLRK